MKSKINDLDVGTNGAPVNVSGLLMPIPEPKLIGR